VILCGSVYDLRSQDKAIKATLCSYSIDEFIIQKVHQGIQKGIGDQIKLDL
jgi:hypothetical protein